MAWPVTSGTLRSAGPLRKNKKAQQAQVTPHSQFAIPDSVRYFLRRLALSCLGLASVHVGPGMALNTLTTRGVLPIEEFEENANYLGRMAREPQLDVEQTLWILRSATGSDKHALKCQRSPTPASAECSNDNGQRSHALAVGSYQACALTT